MSTSRWNLLPLMTLSGLPAAAPQAGVPVVGSLAVQTWAEAGATWPMTSAKVASSNAASLAKILCWGICACPGYWR